MTDADATRLAGKETGATRLSGNASDATRLAGESYRTRIVPSTAIDDQTRITLEGYQSNLARDAVNDKPDDSEFYLIGEKIGDRYEVSAIHHGAMGVVYGCFDHETKLPRALKTVRSRHMQDKQVLSQYESEAAVWISLEKHPYIVRAYEIELFNKLPYVITDYIRGPEGMEGDLRGWLGHPRLTLKVAVEMALQIAQGMQHAVRKVPNLVHRDLKPANILVGGDGKAKVTDFGLVDSAQAGAGTPAYMSPEQWTEDVLDARSDIYAYGCILFEMLTGHRLFSAITESDWKNAHLGITPSAMISLTPDLPDDIDIFVRRCLNKNVELRPKSWDEIVEFFAEWHHKLTGKAVVLDFSSLALDAAELQTASFSLFKLDRFEEAHSACVRALSLDPDDPSAWFLQGHIFSLGFAQYQDAIIAYDRAISIEPGDAKVWYFKGHALHNLKKYAEAIQIFEQALELDTSFSLAWIGMGRSLHVLKNYAKAIDAFDHALAITPEDARIWVNKGDSFERLKQVDEAMHAYSQAIELDPAYEWAYRRKGDLLRSLRRYENEIRLYEQLIQVATQNVVAWKLIGNALRLLNRKEEAVHSYDRALAIDSKDADILCRKGDVLYQLERHEDAIKSYEQALEVNPINAEVWKNLGNALYDLGRYDGAFRAYDEAIAINPDDDDSWYTKGYLLNELKRYKDAIEVFDQALEIHPDHEGAINGRQSAIDALNSKNF